jgi:hypothetical protein
MDEAERLTDRLASLDHGRLVAGGRRALIQSHIEPAVVGSSARAGRLDTVTRQSMQALNRRNLAFCAEAELIGS